MNIFLRYFVFIRLPRFVGWAILGCVLILCNPTQLEASHIIGGEMTYTCMGGDDYEITLTVYRDCFYADPLAFFDDPAAIGIFDSNYNLVDSLMLPLMNNDTLTPILSDSCLFVPDDVCVHTTRYRRTVTLPFRMGGYIFSYQRCCRNQTITNIVDPLNTGATFQAVLTEKALRECNTSAKYQEWPPLFICVNEPIFWDHSATDTDGDSLVYKLCAPFQGADFINNRPQPPLPPPYDHVVWDVPYDLNNLLGGTPLTIDPHTGMLTGTPNTIGQFVVGVCIEEYRDGELIATNTRDFQYNVGQCLQVIPQVGNPNVQCGDLTVDFINTSENANDFLWIFGDPDNPDTLSEEVNPSYTYPDTGFYDIQIIAEPYGECADTFVHTMYLKNSTLTSQFDYFVLDCVDSVVVSASNTSFDTYSNIVAYEWTLSDGQTSTEESPHFAISETDELTLTLVATADDGCSETFSRTFFANVLENGTTRDTLVICPGASTTLNDDPFVRANVVYTWTPAIGLDDPTAENPTATPDTTTLYTVELTDTINNCVGTFNVLVQIQENGGEILTSDTTFCSEAFTIQADSNALVSMQWSDVADFSTTLDTDTDLSVSQGGLNTYYLEVEDELGCVFQDSVAITGGTLDLDIDMPDLACNNSTLQVGINNLDTQDELTYAWQSDFAVADTSAASTSLMIDGVGAHPYTVIVENQYGCIAEVTSNLFVLDDTSPTAFESTQNCEGTEWSFTNPHFNAAYYQWRISGSDEVITGATAEYVLEAGTYQVTLEPIADLPCSLESVELLIEVPQAVAAPDFEWNVQSCGDEVVLEIEDATQVFQGMITDWAWTLDNGMTATTTNPVFTLAENNVTNISLTVNTDEGCTVNNTFDLDLSPYFMDVSSLESNQIRCSTDAHPLNPDGNEAYTYLWSPAETLNDPTAMNPFASPTESTDYTVTITDPATGCVTERVVQLDIADDPLDADFEWTYSDCVENAVVNFEAQASYSGAPISVYNWSYGNGQNNDAPSFTTTLGGEQSLEVTLWVVAEDGCQVSNTQTLNVSLLDLDLNPNTYLCFGESVQLNTGGNPNYTYEWSPATGLNNPNLPMPMASPAETTEYTVTVFDENTGCEVEQSLTIEVPDYEVNLDFDIETVTCEETTQAQFFNTSTFGETVIAAWEWTINGQSTTETNPVIDLQDGEEVRVHLEVTTEDGCTHAMQQAQTFTYTATDVGFINPLLQNCPNEVIALNPNGNPDYEYQWTPHPTLNNDDIMNPLASPSETTTYTVTISHFNGLATCELEREVTVEVEAAATDFIPETLTVCQGASIHLNENPSGNFTYNWNPSISLDDGTAINPLATPSSNTTYQVTLTNQDGLGGCKYIEAVEVQVTDLPSVEATGDETACTEEAALVAITNPANQVVWADNIGFENPLSTAIETSVLPTPSGDEYYVQVTDANGCINTDSITVYDRRVDIEIMETETACINDTFLIEAINIDPTDSLEYIWSPASQLIEGQGTGTIQVVPNENATFNLLATNQYGCEASENVTLDVIDPSEYIDIVSDQDTIREGEQVQLSVIGNVGVAFEWVPPIYLDDPNSATPIATPDENTMFVVSVEDEDGCIGTATHLVIVRPSACEEPFVFIPNSFSPNGDDTNEVLYVQGYPIDEMHLMVFNRWGQKVFESFAPEEGWDGTFKGELLAPDVFGYYLEVKCFNGEEFFKKGNITLLR